MEMYDERFWNYTLQAYTRHIRNIRAMISSIYEDGKYLVPPEPEREFMRIIFYTLMLGYVTGSFGAYVKLNKYAPVLLSWVDYTPEQWAYIEEFIDKNFDSLFWGLPAGKKAKAISDIGAFLPNSATMDAFLWYAENFTAAMSEKLNLGLADRTQEGKDAFRTFAYMVASAEFVRAFQWGLLRASYLQPDVVGFLFVAVLDEKTSRYCRPRHLMFIPREKKEMVLRNCPPLHPHCRSVLEPVTHKVGYERDDTLMPSPPYSTPNELVLRYLI